MDMRAPTTTQSLFLRQNVSYTNFKIIKRDAMDRAGGHTDNV
jgi:hypothetical protein